MRARQVLQESIDDGIELLVETLRGSSCYHVGRQTGPAQDPLNLGRVVIGQRGLTLEQPDQLERCRHIVVRHATVGFGQHAEHERRLRRPVAARL